MAATAAKERKATVEGELDSRPQCCRMYHRAVELIGKRWSGAILAVLMDGPLHFTEIRRSIPEISDRLLSERLKELEAEGLVERVQVRPGTCAGGAVSHTLAGDGGRGEAIRIALGFEDAIVVSGGWARFEGGR